MIIKQEGMLTWSLLEVKSRFVRFSSMGPLLEDCLVVIYKGKECKVSVGFFGKYPTDFEVPKRVVITHKVRKDFEVENLMMPAFKFFDLSGNDEEVIDKVLNM